ncbi:MAG: LURP-one-related/scramblase family protein [Candidatus Jordarchaeum sp.]|uniref:LURP-one-related/scramblase family protein n=1 Tax=Candidatus Jordarchaeum sp. TaxID=2823881 RepID=UPI0040497F54
MDLFDYSTYLVEQKLLTARYTLIIKNEKGQELGKAVSKFLSFRGKIEFTDNQGRKVGSVEGKISARPTFKIIDQNQKHIATIKEKILTIRDDWWVENLEGEKMLVVKGDVLGLEYKIEDKSGLVVAEVSKKFWAIRDHFGVKIKYDFDPFLILSIVVAIGFQKQREDSAVASAS